MQLVIALVFTLIITLIEGVVSPSRLPTDDAFALAINFALAAVFVFCIVLKVGWLLTLLTTHHSLLATHCSLLTSPDSLITKHSSLITHHSSLLTSYYRRARSPRRCPA